MFNLARYCTEVNSLSCYCFPLINRVCFEITFWIYMWFKFATVSYSQLIAYLCLLTTERMKLIQNNNLKFGSCFHPAPVVMVLPLCLTHRNLFMKTMNLN
jgi:hypothetical protein